MVVEALVRSLRPPDRYPPRLASLSVDQEAVVGAWLEHVAADPAFRPLRDEAQQALDEWWRPNPRSRPTRGEIEAARQAPVAWRRHDGGPYRLAFPETLVGGDARDIPEEARRVEVWAGYLRADAHTVVAVNVSPLSVRSLTDAVAARSSLFLHPVSPQQVRVRGARHALRLDGPAGDSPAEPQALTLILAENERDLITLSVRAWPREDVASDVARIVESFEVTPA